MANFIIFMSDEHNPFYSQPYRHQTIRTPNMQAMADNGTVYENAYCPSPLCMPSRSAFMSGKRAHEIQCYSNCNMLVNPDFLSYGKALSHQGVYSVYIGKVDVYAPGEHLGFNEMLRPGDRKPPGDINHRHNPVTIRATAAKRGSRYGPQENASAKDVLCVDEAVNWINNSAKQKENPWVLIVNTGAPHFPHFAPPEFWDMYPEEETFPQHQTECQSARHFYAKSLRQHFQTEKFTAEQIKGLRRGYLACVTFVDQQIGRVLKALKTTGLKDTTNVVYTSDHGEMLGKFGMWWKCSLYEDSVRIPMIAAGPDFSANVRINTPVDLHDLRAGMFKSTGSRQPSGWLGEPLQDIPADNRNRIVFSEYHGHGVPGSSYMIRKGEWKYLYHINAASQLFNIENDPEELVNLAGENKDITADMDFELRNICSPEFENRRAEQFIEKQLKAASRYQ
jgi:choline-sulfatase